jgi:hypothetical protein
MKSNLPYYLLFVLLIMGAFASMAQNGYGVTILGIVAVLFSITFFSRTLSALQMEKKDWSLLVEAISLATLSLIMALRVFYIHFLFVEILFGAAGVALMVVYLGKALKTYTSIRHKSMRLTGLTIMLFLSIALYTLSMVSVAFFPPLAEPSGGAAFGLLILFVAGALATKEILIDGEKVSAFQFVSRFKDLTVVLISLFFLFTLYMGLTKFDWLPRMYSDEFPQSYFELVQRAELGKEKPVNGKYRHQEFKERYNQFVKRNALNKSE